MKQSLGKVSKEIAIKCGIPEHSNKKIVLYPNDKRHCEKRHLKDFANKKHFYYVMSNLDYILAYPDFVYYNSKKDTLEYYKDIGQDISIRVRIENGPELKIKTFFPVEKDKIEDRKTKSKFQKAYNSYVVSEEQI